MPKPPTARAIPTAESTAFGARLVALLERAGQPRRGAGVYLSKRYKVAGVTANAWLNGEYKPEIARAQKIAEDHGSTFEHLYFGRGPEVSDIATSQPNLTLTERELTLIANYRAASDDGRLALEAAASAFAGQNRRAG